MTVNQKILINLVLLIGTYVVPLYIFTQNQNNYSIIETLQEIIFSALFLGAVLLTYINHKNRKDVDYFKWLWIVFEGIGILGVIYSATILYLLFAFRNGIGF